MSLANFLISIGLLAIAAGVGAVVGYFIGRSVDPAEPEAEQLADADEFATTLAAPTWTPPERPRPPVPPRYDHTAVTEPLPPGVFGLPLGNRRPLVAEAFVAGGGKRWRPDGADPSPSLQLALERFRGQPGAITQAINRILDEAQEAKQHVGP